MKGTSEPLTVSLRNCHPFSFPVWGPPCFPWWTPGSQFSWRELLKIKKEMKPSPGLPRQDNSLLSLLPTPPKKRPRDVWLGIQPLAKATRSAAACGRCLRQPLSDWAQPLSVPGLQLGTLTWTPDHQKSWDQQQHPWPSSSPCSQPRPPPAPPQLACGSHQVSLSKVML